MRNDVAVRGFSSVFSFVRTTSPAFSAATFSMIGPSTRHGPHQGAQKSTTTGTVFERSRTSVAKVASVTSRAAVSAGMVVSRKEVAECRGGEYRSTEVDTRETRSYGMEAPKGKGFRGT